jgi:hypothetical protein
MVFASNSSGSIYQAHVFIYLYHSKKKIRRELRWEQFKLSAWQKTCRPMKWLLIHADICKFVSLLSDRILPALTGLLQEMMNEIIRELIGWLARPSRHRFNQSDFTKQREDKLLNFFVIRWQQPVIVIVIIARALAPAFLVVLSTCIFGRS